jgi:dCTP deaminase
MLIGQVTFWVPKGKIKLYDGKYQGSRGPQESQIYKDFVIGNGILLKRKQK